MKYLKALYMSNWCSETSRKVPVRLHGRGTDLIEGKREKLSFKVFWKKLWPG